MRRVFRRFYSIISEEGSVHKVITKDTIGKDGEKISERLSFISHFNKLSSNQKKLLIAYGLLSVGSFTAGVYNDGRQELILYRTDTKVRIQYTDEWHAVKSGCNSQRAICAINFLTHAFVFYKIHIFITPTAT